MSTIEQASDDNAKRQTSFQDNVRCVKLVCTPSRVLQSCARWVNSLHEVVDYDCLLEMGWVVDLELEVALKIPARCSVSVAALAAVEDYNPTGVLRCGRAADGAECRELTSRTALAHMEIVYPCISC